MTPFAPPDARHSIARRPTRILPGPPQCIGRRLTADPALRDEEASGMPTLHPSQAERADH